MILLRELLRGLAETIRETLPGDEREGGAFLSGMCWSFGLFWLTVFVASACSGAR